MKNRERSTEKSVKLLSSSHFSSWVIYYSTLAGSPCKKNHVTVSLSYLELFYFLVRHSKFHPISLSYIGYPVKAKIVFQIFSICSFLKIFKSAVFENHRKVSFNIASAASYVYKSLQKFKPVLKIQK